MTTERIDYEKAADDAHDYIIQHIQGHGYAPCYQEIADAVYLSLAQVSKRLIPLMLEKGLIEVDETGGSHRAIRIPGYKFVKAGSLYAIGKSLDEVMEFISNSVTIRKEDGEALYEMLNCVIVGLKEV